MNSRLAEKLQQGCPSQISLEGRQVANEIKVPKTALGNGLAFKRLDDLWICFALRDQCVECVLVHRGKAAGENGFCGGMTHRLFLPARS